MKKEGFLIEANFSIVSFEQLKTFQLKARLVSIGGNWLSFKSRFFRHKVPFPQSGSHTIIDCECPNLRIRVPYTEKAVLKGCLKGSLRRVSY